MPTTDNQTGQSGESKRSEAPLDDNRRPYEAPRLLKKRSVAQATLFTAMGVSSSGLTTMG